MRLLVVEDDTHITAFVMKGFQQEGFAVDHAADGLTGLELALLGRELDLVVGYDGVKGLEVKGVLSDFIPARAFPQADGSVFASVKVEGKW